MRYLLYDLASDSKAKSFPCPNQLAKNVFFIFVGIFVFLFCIFYQTNIIFLFSLVFQRPSPSRYPHSKKYEPWHRNIIRSRKIFKRKKKSWKKWRISSARSSSAWRCSSPVLRVSVRTSVRATTSTWSSPVSGPASRLCPTPSIRGCKPSRTSTTISPWWMYHWGKIFDSCIQLRSYSNFYNFWPYLPFWVVSILTLSREFFSV